MFKKLALPIVIVAAVTLTLALSFIIREKIASSKYRLSEDGQDYLMACQGAFAASWREDDGLVSYLKIMHYPMALRGCSCVAAPIAASQPDDVETAHIIFVAVNKTMGDASDDLLSEVRALGDELGISEARLTELVNANGDAIKACS
ncbi:hypothetical protein MWU60_04785 [Yoonia sp. F2084L]|uniref:hypothetical protein n=1 Tax=Yoonia sp. F2084L TaxID=2926419 RepID=UPI001FF23722|nr:hypothetical protein [Yoonia sp. F2084L]MCK0094874.1 hypothetical protein [Yoonia sp. F2084L]